MRWLCGRRHVLVEARIRGPKGADFAGGPRLRSSPFDGVVSVLESAPTLIPVLVESSRRSESPADVLDQYGIAALSKVGSASPIAVILIVRGPFNDDGKRSRSHGKIQIRSKFQSIAHRNLYLGTGIFKLCWSFLGPPPTAYRLQHRNKNHCKDPRSMEHSTFQAKRNMGSNGRGERI